MERSRNAQQLWTALLQHVPAPETRQFVVWSNRFSDAQLERAILRTSRKFSILHAPHEPDPANIHRYVTGLLLNLERESKTALN